MGFLDAIPLGAGHAGTRREALSSSAHDRWSSIGSGLEGARKDANDRRADPRTRRRLSAPPQSIPEARSVRLAAKTLRSKETMWRL
jgi:hypothetical protein